MPVNFKFNEGSENLSSHSGLALVGALLERTDLNDRLSSVELINCKEPVISHSDRGNRSRAAINGYNYLFLIGKIIKIAVLSKKSSKT